MASQASAKSALPPIVIVAAILIVLLILGFLGWKTVGSGTSSERVPIDINKVKQNFKKNGFGHK